MSDVLPFDFPQDPIPGQLWPDPAVLGSPVYKYDGVKWTPFSGQNALPSLVPPIMDGIATPGASTAYQRGDHIHPTDTTRAPIHGPTFINMVAQNIYVTNWFTSGATYINNGMVISQMPDAGGQPSVTVYAWDRGYAMGMFLDTNNHLAFGNMDANGVPQTNPANIDSNGHLHLATTLLLGRDPAGAMEVATKQYVDTRTVSGAYLPLTGGAMQGQLTFNPSTGSLNGGPPVSVEVTSNDGDACISFHRSGAFACNFGFGGDWNCWFGGGSYGGGVVYRFWTTRDFTGLPITNQRLTYAADYNFTYNVPMTEPYGGSVQTGGSGQNQVNWSWYRRHRYWQVFTSGWWTVGYA